MSCRPGRELCEIGGGTSVDLGYWVGVVSQCGGPAAAVAEARRSIAQVEPGRKQLAGCVVSQPFDVELDSSRGRQVAGLVRGPVRIPRTGAHRVVGEDIRILGQLMARYRS